MNRALFDPERLKMVLRDAFGLAIREGRPARLGYTDSNGVRYLRVPAERADRPGLFYFHEPEGEQPFHGKASNTGKAPLAEKYLLYDMPILVRQTGTNQWVIDGLDAIPAAEFVGETALQPPANPTRLEMFLPGLLDQTDPPSMRCYVYAAPYELDGARAWYPTALTADFSASPLDTEGNPIELPTDDFVARYVLVELRFSDGALRYKVGDDFDRSLRHQQAWTLDLNDDTRVIFPTVDAGHFRCGYVRLQKGLTAIYRSQHLWAMQDVFTLATPGVGTYYQTVQEDGAAENQRTAMNFVDGEGVALTVTDDAGNDRSDVQADLDINGLTEDASPDGTADYVATWDDSAGAHKKVLLDNLPGGGGGEANTASNVNVGGVGVFKQKTGVDLEFRGVNAASAKISVALDTVNNEIDVDLGTVNLDDLGDVEIDVPADNEVVAYDSGSGVFVNQTAAEAGLAAASHTHVKADVTDLETITTIPAAFAVPKADGAGKIANGWLNTGPGNGLDADTVDGQHANAFAAASAVDGAIWLSWRGM